MLSDSLVVFGVPEVIVVIEKLHIVPVRVNGV